MNGVLVTQRLKAMIGKYAANPGAFFLHEKINKAVLEVLASGISVEPSFKDGRACIKGTSIMVCDIVGDTISLAAPVGFESALYTIIGRESIDAAYAFMMLYPDKVEKDRKLTYGSSLPQDLYR